MNMLDGNTAALSAHEITQDARQKSYDRLLPQAEALLREWVREGCDIGKPQQFKKLSVFILADMITDDPYGYGFDNELAANLITNSILMTDHDWLQNSLNRMGDYAYECWQRTEHYQSALEDVTEYLAECEREDNEC